MSSKTAAISIPVSFLLYNHILGICLLFLQLICLVQPLQLVIGKHYYQEVDIWSSCSKTCGEGVQTKQIYCLRSIGFQNLRRNESECRAVTAAQAARVAAGRAKSIKLVRPKPTVRPCKINDCNATRHLWSASEWGPCSQTCGANGQQMRDVNCHYFEKNRDKGSVSYECDKRTMPVAMRRCNLIDCPVKLRAKKWKKCRKSQFCLSGIQRREIICAIHKANGKLISVPTAFCFRRHQKMPSTWRYCSDYSNTKRCKKNSKLIPKIESVNEEIYQMKRTKNQKITIGSIAYLIQATRIIIKCPVKNFYPRDLTWTHRDVTYKYNGQTTSRIFVSRQGNLRISEFLPVDIGEWTCKAENVTAKTVLKLRNAADGYYDWINRNNARFNDGSMQDQADNRDWLFRDDGAVNGIIQWTVGRWSKCSVSCNGVGREYRRVQCERLDKRFYVVLDKSKCKSMYKPSESRKCDNSNQACPDWAMINRDEKKCTDKCLDIGQGMIQGELFCKFQGISLPFHKCSQHTMPNIKCTNSACQLEWKVGPWSKCSKSCGDSNGIQARYLRCVWKNSKEPAGNLCYDSSPDLIRNMPTLTRTCQPPPCILKCLDIAPYCRPANAKFCHLRMFQFYCCRTCKNTLMSRFYSKKQKSTRSPFRKPLK